VLARVICGEGIPDFYAKRSIGLDPSCLSPFLDDLLKPILESEYFFGKNFMCIDMEERGYTKDENGDFIISDCQKKIFSDYYHSP